ncbi:MAG: hypothetical protein ISS26_00040 [Candidatus Omnitrophica bacterium]|nr:hypothetical protein [Candidatus Omnitrophota bacterium]
MVTFMKINNKKNTKRKLIILSIGCALILCIASAWLISHGGSKSKIYDQSFANVIDYMSDKFTLDITKCVERHPEVWGPSFLKTYERYWIETEKYLPDKELKFKAWYYQIGGEDIIFTIVKINEEQTEISVDHVIHFFATISYLPISEQRILNIVEKELKEKN